MATSPGTPAPSEPSSRRRSLPIRTPFDDRETFRLIFDGAPIGMALVGLDGRFLEVNATLCEMLESVRERLLATSFLRITHRDDRAEVVGLARRLVEDPTENHRLEKRYLRKNREAGWAIVTAHLQPGSDGEPQYFIVQLLDISERKREELARRETEKRLRQNEEQYRKIFESVTDGLIVLSSQGEVVDANPAACRMHGYSREEFLRLDPRQFIHPDSHLHFAAFRDAINSGNEYHSEGRDVRADGAAFDVEVDGTPFQFRGRGHILGVIRDIAGRKEAERRLASYTRALERSNRDLEDFASVASHDLQEPLRKIQTFASRLEERCSTDGQDAERRYIERILGAAEWASTLIQDLLAYSRVTAREKRFQEVNLDAVAREVLQQLEDVVARTGARIEIGELPTLQGDPTQLRQLLQNLIGNALKFRHPERPPVVRVLAERTKGLFGSDDAGRGGWRPMVRLTIADNGVGFDEEYRARIFGVFQRLHSGQYAGTGMGLAICRRIADRHGGKIEANGRPGEGASFVVCLPSG